MLAEVYTVLDSFFALQTSRSRSTYFQIVLKSSLASPNYATVIKRLVLIDLYSRFRAFPLSMLLTLVRSLRSCAHCLVPAISGIGLYD